MYKVTIGLEIHLELNTKTKMFSSAPNTYGKSPNSQVSSIDIAYPGTLPLLNKIAVVYAIKMAKALKMKIEDVLVFDRKHYFYPDLPKGFQITQHKRPIGYKGIVPISNKKINIERIHLEEDTAKSLHDDEYTLLDYNRAGIPLIEIVTDPIIENQDEAKEYVRAIRDVARTLNISDAKMENGSLRVDVNVSVSKTKKLGTKVEIKNINSLHNLGMAIENEVKEQIDSLNKGKKVTSTTKRFDEKTDKNVVMRVKNTEVDYRYFEEPNIPLIKLRKEFIDSIIIPTMPWERREKYLKQSLTNEYVQKLMNNLNMADFYDKVDFKDKEKLVKIIFAEISPIFKDKFPSINTIELKKILEYEKSGKLSGKLIKQIIPKLVGDRKVDEVIKTMGITQINSKSELEKIVKMIINDNKEMINKNIDRIERVEKMLMGQIMKHTKGQANPKITNQLIDKYLKELK